MESLWLQFTAAQMASTVAKVLSTHSSYTHLTKPKCIQLVLFPCVSILKSLSGQLYID